jgi:hypothetical protein
MTNVEIYENLKALQNRAFNLSKKDRDFIKSASMELNVGFNPKSRCMDCYRDQIIILLIAVKKHVSVIENKSSVYKMVNGKNIKWRGQIINDETLTDELAEKFISNLKNWFIFIEKK